MKNACYEINYEELGVDEMTFDMYKEITNAMFNAYCENSFVSRGVAAAREVMNDMLTVLCVSETVKSMVFDYYERTFGHLI